MFDKNLMKLPGMRAVMGALVLLALLQAASVIGQAIGLSRAICVLWDGAGTASSFPDGSGVEALVSGSSPLEAAFPDIVLFAVCFVLMQLVRFAQETMLDRYSLKQAKALRSNLLGRVFDARCLLPLHVGAARVVQAANDGVDEVQTYVRIIPPKIVGMVAVSLPLLVCVFAFDWVSGVILAVMFPVIIFFMVLIGQQARERSERQYAVYTRLTNRFMDTLRGLPVLKAFGAARREEQRVYSSSENLRKATMRTLQTAMLSGAVLDLCATFGVAAVAIMLAFRLMDGSLALYTGLVALIIAPEYFTPIRSFASDYHASLDGKNALAAVLEMLGGVSAGGEDDVAGSRPGQGAFAEGDQDLAVHTVAFHDVSCRYGTGVGVERVSFTVQAGQKVGVIGKSGAGKSTLASLFAGFRAPDGGEVLVDDVSTDLTSDSWKRLVRYIPQSPFMFHTTLADNISFYRPDATREEVEAVASAVGLDALVAELPDGLDTMVGEGARGLSGGQAHRVALARVLLDNRARVLVFDEPTAHLDIETERDLKPAMLAAMEGKLVLFATHRLHWMADMDRVITLEDGRVTSDSAVDEHPPQPLAASNQPCSFAAPGSGMSSPAGSLPSDREDESASVCEAARVCESNPGPSKADGSSEVSDASRSLPGWFKGYLSRYKRDVAAAVALGFVASACAALLMFTSGYLISATALAGTTLFSIMIPVAFVQLFGFGRPLARYAERLASHNWVLRVTSDLRLALYRAVEERTGDPARERVMGEYLGILSDDVAHLQNAYLRVVFPSCVAYLTAIGAALLFGFFSLSFALVIALSFAAITVLLPFACLLATRAAVQQAKDLKAAEYAHLGDDVYGVVDWVLAARQGEVLGRHEGGDAAIRTLEARVRMTQRSLTLVVTAALAVVLCSVIVWAAGQFAVPAANVNWIAAFTLGFFPLIEAFTALPSAFSEATSHRDSLVRLDGYLADAGEAGKAKTVEDSKTLGHEAFHAIELHGATYTYPGSASAALKGLTLTVRQGESVAVLGRSGAGKSTFANVLCGVLSSDSGIVRICGEVTTPETDVSRIVGFVGQTPYLFNRTLRDNLTLGVLEASDGQLAKALRDVGLGEKLSSLKDGLDTVIGETGVGFSGGEAHRIAIARVLVANTPIVVVDEPFSALDPETEHDLLNTLLAACAGRTLIVITHHLAQIDRFDRVIFIENGRIDLDGAPSELARTTPRFRELIEFDETPKR